MWQQLSLMPVKILVFDPDESARGQLRQALEASSAVQVVGEARSAESARGALHNDTPDVLIVDIALIEHCAQKITPAVRFW